MLYAVLLPLLLLLPSAFSSSPKVYYVCSHDVVEYLGIFKVDPNTSPSTVDDFPVYVNDEGMGIWRHEKFWYAGDFNVWPPDTQYRCVLGCEEGLEAPPLRGLRRKGDNRIEDEGGLVLQETPCSEGEF